MLVADAASRERFALWSGAAAVSLVTLLWVAAIAGHSPGSFPNRLALTLVLLYLCARFWAHALTLGERGVHAALARAGVASAPVVFLLLLAQTWTTAGVRLTLGLDAIPRLHVSTFTRLEWTADIAVFTLFFATAIAVWTLDAEGTPSALLAKVAYVVLGVLAADLLAAAWSVVSVVPQWRLVLALLVLALGGAVLIATVRRLERLDT